MAGKVYILIFGVLVMNFIFICLLKQSFLTATQIQPFQPFFLLIIIMLPNLIKSVSKTIDNIVRKTF